MKYRPVVLFVGGTDPSGGAGLAADIKSCAAVGGHGCIAVTAVTVQNSAGVSYWNAMSPKLISSQMLTTCDDGRPDAVKTGMLGSEGAVESVARTVREKLSGVPFVLDPVLVAGSGDNLATDNLAAVIKRELLPLATLVTPNLDEAEALTGKTVRDRKTMEQAAVEILAMGPQAVLLKGGHLEGEPADVLATTEGITWFQGSRIVDGKVHGTGCTLASACATLIAGGYDTESAVRASLAYLRSTIAASFNRKLGTIPGHFPGMGAAPGKTVGEAFYRTPRFCPACGAELAKTSPHPVCPRCGLVFYRNPLPAVVLVLEKEGKVLLARRAAPPAKGELGFPGGFVDLGEAPEEAAKRELEEETGLTGGSYRLVQAESDSTDYGSVVLFVYRVSDWQGEPEANDDVTELLWCDTEHIPELAFSAHNRIADTIKNKRGDSF